MRQFYDNRICLLLSLLVSVILLTGGCKDKDKLPQKESGEETDYVSKALLEDINNVYWPSAAKDRAKLALLKWKDNVTESDPILIASALNVFNEDEESKLALSFYDENRDVVGVRIREICNSQEEPNVIEEYPIYIHNKYHNQANAVACLHLFPCVLRKQGQLKDQTLWKNYEDANYADIVMDWEDYYEGFPIKASTTVEILQATEGWQDTLPPILISVPEPNKVEVMMSVYDANGNESEFVPVIRR